jgi:hypothetical protein
MALGSSAAEASSSPLTAATVVSRPTPKRRNVPPAVARSHALAPKRPLASELQDDVAFIEWLSKHSLVSGFTALALPVYPGRERP